MSEAINIQTALKEYKAARNNRTKERSFLKLKKYFNPHFKALLSITKGIKYGENPTIYNIMLSNLTPKTYKNYKASVDEKLYNIQTICSSYSYEDIEQTLNMLLIKLIDEYKKETISFFSFITYLLPRRMSDIIWNLSKDPTNQFYNLSIDGLETDFDLSMFKYENEIKDTFLSEFFTGFEYELFLNILKDIPDKELIQNFELTKDTLKFQKKRLISIAENISTFVAKNNEFAQKYIFL